MDGNSICNLSKIFGTWNVATRFLYISSILYFVPILKKCKRDQLSTAPLKSKGGFYFPTDDDSDFKRETNIKIVYQDSSIEVFKYEEIVGPFYWDVDDLISAKEKNSILSKRGGKQSVVVGIPTYGIGNHIYNTLMADKKQRDILHQLLEINAAHKEWDIELIVNVTPKGKTDTTMDTIRKVQKESLEQFPWIKVTLMIMPIRGKVNAMNAISDYAIKKNATILCFLDDDTLHSPKKALLKNIEMLLSADDISIVTSTYCPPQPTNLWEKIRVLRFLLHENITVTGRAMIMHAKSYPKIPSYLNSDDLYITAYFLDAEHSNPFRRILVNRDALAISKLAGKNALFGMKAYRRCLLGIYQLLAVMPNKKRQAMKETIRGDDFFSELKNICMGGNKSYMLFHLMWTVIRAPFIFDVKLELLIRKCIGVPKKTIIYFRDESTFL